MLCEFCSVQSLCSKTYSTYILSHFDHLVRRTEKNERRGSITQKKLHLISTDLFIN